MPSAVNATNYAKKRKPGQNVKKPTAVTKITLPGQQPITPRPAPMSQARFMEANTADAGVAPRRQPSPQAALPGNPQSNIQSTPLAGPGGMNPMGSSIGNASNMDPTFTGNTGAVPGVVTSPMHGLAGSFDQALLPYVYAQPELILGQLMKNMGMNPTGAQSGSYAAVTPYMDQLMSLMPLAWGGGAPPDASSPINWMGRMAQSGMTPGGAGINFSEVLDAMRSGAGDSTSAIGQLLGGSGMDPLDQINKTKQMVLAGAGAGLPPQFQAAIQNAMNSAALDYMQRFTTSPAGSLGNFAGDALNGQWMKRF